MADHAVPACTVLQGREALTAEGLINRLEEAGVTLLSLSAAMPSMDGLEWLRHMAANFSALRGKLRQAAPNLDRVARMEQTYRWVATIPEDRYVLRRVVGARSLVNPVTGRHLHSWRRLGTAIGADHRTLPLWHAQGIGMIVTAIQPPVGGARL